MTDQPPNQIPPEPPSLPGTHPSSPHEDPTRRAAGERTLRRQLFAWCSLAIFCVGVIMSDSIVRLIAGPAALFEDVSEVSSFQIEVVGKFSLGARSVMGDAMGSGALQKEQLTDLALPLPEIAAIKDPHLRGVEYVHHLRTIFVLTEFMGADEGIEQLDAFLEVPDVPEGLPEDARLARRIYESGPETLTTDEQNRLIDRHAWAGRLAVSFSEPPGAPERDIVLHAARISFFGLMSLAGVGIVVVPVGFALFVVGVILLATGKIRPRYRPDIDTDGPRHAAYLEVISLFMGALVLIKLAGGFLERANPDNAIVGILGLGLYAAQWALLLLVFWPLARGVRIRQLVRGLGWEPGKGVFHEIGAGIVGYLAGMPILIVGFLMMFGLMWLTGIEPSHPIVERAGQHDVLNILFIYSIAVIWAPLVEESVFRGAFYHHLRRWLGPVLSALIVAVVFAGVHPQGFVAMPPLMALAFVFAMIREWRASIFGCMAAHALHNGVLMTLNIFFLSCIG